MVSAPVLTPYLDEDPCPRVEVFFDDLHTGTAFVTVYRMAGGREEEVQGAIFAPTAGALTRIDFAVPFNVPVTYRAQMFDGARVSLGFTPAATVTVLSDHTWLHNPLNPHGAVKVSLAASTGQTISRPVPGTVSRPRGRSVGVILSEPRQGVVGLRFDVRAESLETADRVQALIGGYAQNITPVICIRLGGDETRLRVPQPLFLGVLDIVEADMNVAWGGEDTRQLMVGDEAAPPAPGLFIPLLTAADINAFYATATALKADNLTGAAVNRRYDLAGFAS